MTAGGAELASRTATPTWFRHNSHIIAGAQERKDRDRRRCYARHNRQSDRNPFEQEANLFLGLPHA